MLAALLFVVLLVPLIEIERARYIELFSGVGKTEYRLFGITFWSKDGSRSTEPMPGTALPLMSETWIYAGSTGRSLFGRGASRCTDNGKIPLAHHELESILTEWDVENFDIARARFVMATATTHLGPLWLEPDYDTEVLWGEPVSGEPGETRIQLWPIDEQGEFAQLLKRQPSVDYMPDYP